MRSCSERQMPVGGAGGVEAAGVREAGGVVVGGDVVDHDVVALGDFLAADFGVGARGAHEVLDGGGPADGLFDDAVEQAAIGFYARELCGVLREREHGAGGGGAGGVVPGAGGDDV